MAQVDYPEPVKALISHLKRLPGIGPKSAERIAVWMMQQGSGLTMAFSDSVQAAGNEVFECIRCGFFSTAAHGCSICEGSERDGQLLCIVEQPTDILPLERSGAFRGHYHSLRGRISPLDNVGPEDLRIRELIGRLQEGGFTEVILALNSDVEGEATSNYLAELLHQFPLVKISRLAQGLPAGGGLTNADELTLMRALQGRVGM
ncbi:MAG: recombination protein RecR [Verrucomicrobiales bacterium]|jgi:recombination protein RecR|nr:recombination protein RecR [Verrucomicrobiales bacterium]MBP9222752.1 recombination protein RecR [Verrucomicrobiales bacterium]HQZ28978.1 recombination mediator RecR [Verrucomicrobiales bacterium]